MSASVARIHESFEERTVSGVKPPPLMPAQTRGFRPKFCPSIRIERLSRSGTILAMATGRILVVVSVARVVVRLVLVVVSLVVVVVFHARGHGRDEEHAKHDDHEGHDRVSLHYQASEIGSAFADVPVAALKRARGCRVPAGRNVRETVRRSAGGDLAKPATRMAEGT